MRLSRQELHERQVRDLKSVLQYTLREGEEEGFRGMLSYMQASNSALLSERQTSWLVSVLEKHEPRYENLVSAGKVPRGKEVESLVRDKPLRPPTRKTG